MNFFYKLLYAAVAICPAAGTYAQNVGIGTTTPQSQLSVGPSSQFRVDNDGNLIRINDVVTSFPSSQGDNGQVLTNDGSGNLSWTTPATGSSGAIFGSGTAGALNIPVGNTVDWSTGASFASVNSLEFTTITIAGTLIVPSGLLLKATGNVTITGTITVQPSPAGISPTPGITGSSAETYYSGTGLGYMQAAGIVRAPLAAGGAGKIVYTGNNGDNGGNGGGGFTVYAKGNISVNVGGSINANGANGINVQTTGASIIGTGGGAGGVVVLAAAGTISVNGNIRANGGNGAAGFNGNGGTGEGGGGGGGGGIIVLIAPATASITGTLTMNGGMGGANASAVSPSTTILSAGGGGACGGNGGNGGGIQPGTTTNTTSTNGSAGRFVNVVVTSVENHLLGR